MSFLNPCVFNQEIIDFFTHANIGPLIEGDFQDNGKPIVDSLQTSQRRLNDGLNFIKPDHPNYGITIPGSLTPLFALHARHAKMQQFPYGARLSASNEMRKYLRQTMIKVIHNDCDDVFFSTDDEDVNKTRKKMIECIDNPDDLSLKHKMYYINGGEREIFNPNWFLYAHFSKLITAGKAEMNPMMREENNLIQLARAYKM
jgi:hypothetical protein